MDYNLLFCLKVLFVIFFFCFNICLIYTEYLEKKQAKKDNTHLQAGLHPTFKNAAKNFLMVMGAGASYVALKNEYKDLTKESTLQAGNKNLADMK
jgi:hypothetical protein